MNTTVPANRSIETYIDIRKQNTWHRHMSYNVSVYYYSSAY